MARKNAFISSIRAACKSSSCCNIDCHFGCAFAMGKGSASACFMQHARCLCNHTAGLQGSFSSTDLLTHQSAARPVAQKQAMELSTGQMHMGPCMLSQSHGAMLRRSCCGTHNQICYPERAVKLSTAADAYGPLHVKPEPWYHVEAQLLWYVQPDLLLRTSFRVEHSGRCAT